MGAVARARDLQREGDAKIAARLCKGLCILASVRIVEIHRDEMATVIGQQRLHADGVATGKVFVNCLIYQWQQRAVAAVCAFDAGLSQTPGRHSFQQAGA